MTDEMKSFPWDERQRRLLLVCQDMRARGGSVEAVISFLRQQGCSKVETICLIARAESVSLSKAKEWVHGSAVWEDVRERDERIHEVLEEAAERFEEEV